MPDIRRSLSALPVLAALALLWGGPAGSAPAPATPAASAPQPAAAASDPTLFTLTPEQLRALRLVSQPLAGPATAASAPDGAAASGLRSRHPGRVVVPESRQRVLAAPVAALVERLQVGVGDEVRAGQVLATLRSPAAQDLQREAQAAAMQAELAQSTLTRDQRLFDEGLIAAARLEATRAQARQATLLADDRRRALAQAGAAAQANGGVVTLTSPISGTVIERQATVGQRLEAAAPLLRIAALDTLWVELQVPVREAAALRVGDAVQLDEPALPARVIAIARAVDAASQTVMVRAAVQAPAAATAALRVGQGVQAELLRAPTAGLAVPAGAVVQHGGRDWVFADLGGGRLRALPVQVLQRSGQGVLVRPAEPTQTPGLVADTRLVVQGTASLKALLATALP
ncbi:efflux RND transporter periplasmic adaptor subunit [Ideonella sp. DXS22W]|uniref:Efflux RND transporter periplasmic adaptor subunit n=1 Tax=Pseudaquabacterium inlustre TaxID=2984192 RepID=A0ABU9CM65_9BURK